MKTILSYDARDFIISYKLISPLDKETKEPKWINKSAGIAEHFKKTTEVVVYVPEYDFAGNPTNKATCVSLDPDSILLLADKIREMKKEVINTEWVIDDYDDLPF